MEEFRAGTLDLQEGTTLRSFLATKLNCKPKRISKKYEGKNYDGKQLFWKSEEDFSPEELHQRRTKLETLKAKFEECLHAIEIVKASRDQTFPASASPFGEAKANSLFDLEQHRAAVLGASVSASGRSMGSLLREGSASQAIARSNLPLPTTTSDLMEMEMLLARQQRQLQAMESLAGVSQSNNQFFRSNALASTQQQQPQISSRLESYLSSRQDAALLEAAAAARQDAALLEAAAGLGSFPRPTSPSVFGNLNSNQPSSPQLTSSSYNQARLAMAVRGNSFTGSTTGSYHGNRGVINSNLYSTEQQQTSPVFPTPLPPPTTTTTFRPSLNAMLANRRLGGRQTSGNRQAQSVLEENMLRFQQPVRDLGTLRDQAARRFSSSVIMGEQKAASDDGKRSLGNDNEIGMQQPKRQRFF